MKQTWEKPQLTVLVRGTPEESVLAPLHCKNQDLSASGNTGGCANSIDPCQDNGGKS